MITQLDYEENIEKREYLIATMLTQSKFTPLTKKWFIFTAASIGQCCEFDSSKSMSLIVICIILLLNSLLTALLYNQNGDSFPKFERFLWAYYILFFLLASYSKWQLTLKYMLFKRQYIR
ncbi:MAG: hypothetical protein MHMPM18_002338, partial [Marteilia pararefringens]